MQCQCNVYIHTGNTPFKNVESVRFFCNDFLKKCLMLTKAVFIWLQYSKNFTVFYISTHLSYIFIDAENIAASYFYGNCDFICLMNRTFKLHLFPSNVNIQCKTLLSLQDKVLILVTI